MHTEILLHGNVNHQFKCTLQCKDPIIATVLAESPRADIIIWW